MKNTHKYLLIVAILVGALILGSIAVKDNISPDEEPNAPDPSENLGLVNGPVFKLTDLHGIDYNLTDFVGSPVLIHFMSVSCGGQFASLNDGQLKQLKLICDNLCDNSSLRIFTVLVSTCTATDLSPLYDMYNITWILGNDYQDSKLDVVEAYSENDIEDGTVLLLGKDLQVNEVINESISADSLIKKIRVLDEG